MLQFPKTEYGQTIAKIIRQGTNFKTFNDAMMIESVNGFSCILDVLSSTTHSNITIICLLVALSNAMVYIFFI